MPLTSPGKFKTDGNGNSYGGANTGNNFLSTALNNTLVGASAGVAITDGDRNTVIGSGAAPTLTTAVDNIAIGFGALQSCDPVNTSDVVAIGKNSVSLNASQLPTHLVAIGNGCCAVITNVNVVQTVIMGSLALSATSPTGVVSSAVVIGYNAGVNSGDAANNSVFIGASAGLNTSGSSASLVYIGSQAGQGKSAVGSRSSVAIGTDVAHTALGGSIIQTVLVGASAGSNTSLAFTNVRSVGLGYFALSAKISTDDVVIGANAFGAGVAVTSDNVVIGSGAAQNSGGTINNTLIGSGVAASLTTGSGNTIIGMGVDVSSATAALGVRIGAGGSASPLIDGSEKAGERPILLNGVLRLRRTPRATNITSTDETIIGCTATNIAITIPTVAIARSGSIFIIKDEAGTATGISAITVAGQSGTIDGAASKTIITAYGVLRLYSDGTNLFTF